MPPVPSEYAPALAWIIAGLIGIGGLGVAQVWVFGAHYREKAEALKKADDIITQQRETINSQQETISKLAESLRRRREK